MTDFSKNILGKIKKEKIKPISKWNFIFKKSFVWAMFVVSIILGGFAFGSILTQINATEWDIHRIVSDSLIHLLFTTLPYLWILFMLGFSTLAYYYLRHTSKGYRYNTVIIVNSSILISVLFGFSLYATGLSHRMEATFEAKLPFYNKIMNPRAKIWMMPEEGLLAGKIIEINNKQEIKLEDLKKGIWTVDISNVNWKRDSFLEKNIQIKALGYIDGELFFVANEIRPWGNLIKDICRMDDPQMPCPEPPQFFPKEMKENVKHMRSTE